jgi:tetratricopeptide (TPR) repeat protein
MSRAALSSIVDRSAPIRSVARQQSKEFVLRILSRNYLAVSVSVLALSLGLACGQDEDPMVEIRRLHEEGRYAATVDQLRALVDEDPSRAEAQFLLGTALLHSGNGGLAVWPLRAATKAPEYAIEARMLLARAMLESRTAPDAIPVINEVLELEPENIPAMVLRIQAHQAGGANDEALADIERVLELDPTNIPVLVPRVTSLIATQQIDEAEVAIEAARERLENTDEEVDPSFRATLCVARGMFAFEKGEREVAEAQYADCLEQFPAHPMVVQETARFHELIGEEERAIEILQEAFDATGNSVFRLAIVQRMRRAGDAEEEERLLRAEAEERPSTTAWFALADFHVGRDEFDEALEAFDHALALSPNPPETLLFAYADTLVQAEQFEKARSLVEGFEQSALRDLIIGRIHLAQGDPAAALVSFEAGILLWPNNPAARYLAGEAAERVGDFERAISEYRESIRANAGRTTAALELAELYYARGHFADALDAVQRYMQAKPGDVEGTLAGIRIAHKARRFGIATEGLNRLSGLPEHAGTAVAEHATLLAESSPDGATAAVKTIEESDLDLTDPVNAQAVRVLLEHLAELGEHAKAQERIASALAAHPDAAVFNELNGQVLSAAGKSPEKAREAFDRALELDPNHAEALSGLAALSAQAGEIDAALELYDRAAKLDPEDSAAVFSAAKLELGAGRTAGARARFEALLAHHPREAEAAIELARILAEQGEFDASLDYARRAEWLRSPQAEETLASIEGLRAQRGAAGNAPASD